MKCHYIYDKKFGKVLIPGCWAVSLSGEMERCSCRDFPKSAKEFEKKEYTEELRKKDREIEELEKEVVQLYRIIRRLTGRKLKHRLKHDKRKIKKSD